MSEAPSVRDWLDASINASNELATVALGLEGSELIGIRDVGPEETGSAFIALVGEANSVQIGFSADSDGCRKLAQILLGMEPDDDDLEDEDIADAVGEMANILGGQVKTIMAEKAIAVNLGIPIFIHGHVEVSGEMEVAAADVRLGDISATIFVLAHDVKA
ncbi:MAG: chemotaxis protein CheX [Deltaproteobacteria bacterium]|nr:chemotaxis protein CheX [Deltaproteobacteria bacterium]